MACLGSHFELPVKIGYILSSFEKVVKKFVHL